jgi:hypothetical protein
VEDLFGNEKLRWDVKGHLIDDIIQCSIRRDSGEYHFQVRMYCECCLGREYWVNEREIRRLNSPELDSLVD